MCPDDYEDTIIKAGESKTRKEGLSVEAAAGETRLGWLSSLGSQRRGGFGDRFRGSAWGRLLAAHCLRV